ncbi:MAG TPA: glycosyltransferase [Candidatus Saccharimonadales bacterium]|nr:glycosyltransferase [Candidatus Saccharimonadales bacterium]
MNTPLVSIIVTTYNNHATLDACLASITAQTYPHCELIVVDNASTDDTIEIAKRYTSKFFIKTPERSTQRNFGVRKARGEYVVIIDSDMELQPEVIANCVATAEADPTVKGIIIPEESFGQGFWAQCKRLERSFYVGIDWIEAARFFRKATFEEVGGYNEALVSGEDWDLSQRVGAIGTLARVDTFILHNEQQLKLMRTLRKKFYYAGKFTAYTAQTVPTEVSRQPTNIVLRRFGLYFSRPQVLLGNPLLGVGMLFMKVAEFGCGAAGYLWQQRKREVA